MKITRNKIIAALVIVAVLGITFVWGGGFAKGNPSSDLDKENDIQVSKTLENKQATNVDEQEILTDTAIKSTDAALEKKDEKESNLKENSSKVSQEKKTTISEEKNDKNDKNLNTKDVTYSESKGMDIDPETGKDKYLTDPVPEGKPIPVEPGTVEITKTPKTCTISIQCKTILDNIDDLDKEKVELVPEDGVIMPATTVTFYEGESVFNLLQRETKKNKIHMEFENTPIYNSAYIEGIHNLYEFDCGELSGWMYKVNGWFPNYGCSRYVIKQGDVIEWIYTCDLGRDIGGGFDE